MYWTDWGEIPKIERAAMDGNQTSRSVLVDRQIYFPNGLTLDYEFGKLYWIDAKFKSVYSCNFDGTDRQAVIGGLQHPFAITISENTLFWTDWTTKSIYSCNKHTCSDITVVLKSNFQPMDVQVFSQNRQPIGMLHDLYIYFECVHHVFIELL